MAQKSIACKAVIIGGSAGSFETIVEMLPRLSGSLRPALIIVQHRSKGSDDVLVQLLRQKTTLPVLEATEKSAVLGGHIYIAPADYHLLIERNETFSLDASEKINFCRPAIDVTFASAAEIYGPALCCILLSGSNSDGARGLEVVNNSGGITVIENPDTAAVNYMPKSVYQYTVPDHVLNATQLAGFINNL